MKKLFTLLCICLIIAQPSVGQNLYYRLDLATNNIYSFAAANIIGYGLNKATDTMLFDTAYTYTHIKMDGGDAKGYNIAGLTARDLTSDLTAGGKFGFQSLYSDGAFNWGIFASARYRINKFKSLLDGQQGEYRHDVQRAQLGGGIMLRFGGLSTSTHVFVEAELRYDIPVKYSGVDGFCTKDVLNKGLSSRYSIRINGNGTIRGIGLYAEIPHYHLFKQSVSPMLNPDVKMFTVGLIYTITPWEAD